MSNTPIHRGHGLIWRPLGPLILGLVLSACAAAPVREPAARHPAPESIPTNTPQSAVYPKANDGTNAKNSAPSLQHAGQNNTGAEPDAMVQKVSYIVGYRLATQGKERGFTLSEALFIAGIDDIQSGRGAKINQADETIIMTEFKSVQQAKATLVEDSKNPKLIRPVNGAENSGKKAADIKLPGSKHNSLEEKVSYVIGSRMAAQSGATGFIIDQQQILKALEDVRKGAKSSISAEEQAAVMTAFEKQNKAAAAQRAQVLAQENLRKGEEFLAQNRTAAGIEVTPSALQYKVLQASKESKPKTPKLGDTVKVHYRGQLIDGTVFDSSIDKGEPVVFPVSSVIPGWIEALQVMKTGDKFQIFVPAQLAYGAGETGGIPANSVLIFELHLLAVEGKK
ncbi:MAG: hypothetical protein RL497_54 [Pseudomonadota bacterium]|jgi:FKBP-type peptidyl-prolyl cis-trans isomerase